VVVAERVQVERQPGGRARRVGARDVQRVRLQLPVVLWERAEVRFLRDVTAALAEVETAREDAHLETGGRHRRLGDGRVELREVDVVGEIGRRLVADRDRLVRVGRHVAVERVGRVLAVRDRLAEAKAQVEDAARREVEGARPAGDRKSTRLNSSHRTISYAVFCLKKKTKSSTPAQVSSNIRL